MPSNRSKTKKILEILILIIFLTVLLAIPFQLPGNVGAADFRPYWSASYLLAHGQDFSDAEKLDDVERILTGWEEPFTMHAWFAPSGNLILLPFTIFSFSRATFYWLLTNTIIVLLSSILIWGKPRTYLWVPLTVTFGFSMTLLSLNYGQVNTLEMLGLALFLALSELKYDFRAGLSLGLTTVKPHLVIITLPILLLDLIRKKQWSVLAGFFSSLLFCVLVLTILYPAWPVSFWNLVTSGMETVRATPTINGLLVASGEYILGKWLWLFTLALCIMVWWNRKKEWDRRTLIDITILVGMIVSPIGWSYDQVMLLFPILRICKWMASGGLIKKDMIIILGGLISINAIAFYLYYLEAAEVWFFWIPMSTALLYFYAWQRKNDFEGRSITTRIEKSPDND